MKLFKNLFNKCKKKGGVKTLALSPVVLLASTSSTVVIAMSVVCGVVVLGIIAAVIISVVKKHKANKPEPVKQPQVAEKKVRQPKSVKATKAPETVVATQTQPVERKTEVVATETKEVVTESENKTPEFDKTKLSGATTITDADGEVTEEVVGIDDATGMAIIVRYKKSFTARIIQSADESKGYYSELKNYILSYKKTTSRVSWGYDSINSGRNQLAKFVVRGKTLCLYLALNAADYTDSKYKVEAVESKKYEDTPCLYRIKNDLRLKYAKELIDTLAEKQGLEKGDEQNEDYRLPYETTEALVEKGLIKELVTEEKYEQFMYRRSQAEVDKNRRQFVSATEVNAIIDDDVAATLVEVASDKSGWSGKKGIVNIDDLSANFASGDRVTLNDLKEKGLVAKNVGYIKVLARGVLDKPLTVEANDYSLQAVKMILITGGHARKV